MAEETVGQRNKNYLNIKNNPANPWKGMSGVDAHGHAIFTSPAYGLRAAILNLRSYWFSYGLHTVEGIISRWAPADDTIGSIVGNQQNNPSEYTNFVCEQIHLAPSQDLELFHADRTLGNTGNLQGLIDAMAKFENGAEFTLPKEEFLDALKLVQPEFSVPVEVPTKASPAPAPANNVPPVAPDVPAVPVPPADPLKDLGGPLLEQLKRTTVYELFELLLTKKATPTPKGDEAIQRAPALPTGEFVVNGHILERLMAINSFLRNKEDKLIFFGLRGCLPAEWPKADSSFAPNQTLKLVEINYENARCTIGQWDTEKDSLAVFPGSTVPTLKYVVEAEKKAGSGANQLMTGYFLFEKGVHREGQPTGHEAFRQLGTRACRRTADNEVAVYQPTDPVSEVDDDNLHAAFGDKLEGTYSSAGCQVVLGYPQCQEYRDVEPWPTFRKAAYAIEQKQFSYILLDGVQVAQIVKDPDAPTPLLLRCGSLDSALPRQFAGLITQIQTSLKEVGSYTGNLDGNFGAQTAAAVAKFQNDKVGPMYVDAVVGPQTGKYLLNKTDWPTL